MSEEAIYEDDPRYDGFRINELYAFTSVEDGTDQEGIISAVTSDGKSMPLIGADLRRVESLRSGVESFVKEHNVKVKLVKFSVREEIEIFDPEL